MSRTALLLSALLPAVTLAADEPRPPKGFVALFNGKDLSGWHGMPHYDPYKLEKLSPSERQKLIDQWTEDARKHWQVQGDDLVNDGKGAYLTTDQEFGDI